MAHVHNLVPKVLCPGFETKHSKTLAAVFFNISTAWPYIMTEHGMASHNKVFSKMAQGRNLVQVGGKGGQMPLKNFYI
jgi:hypothetical protein